MSDNRLVEIFEELQEKGLVRTKKEYAALLGAGYANLVNAMGGSPVSLTKSIIVKAEQLRTRLLNGDPAPAPPRNVEELSPAEMLRIIGGQADTIRSQQEVIARLLGADTKKGAV